MRVLITGGAGFIGSHLCDRLLARGDEVTIIDNFATGRRDNLTEGAGQELIEGSIVDRDLVFQVFKDAKPQVVVHAAASYKDPEDWSGDSATNAVGTTNVVQAAEALGAERLIYFQTALCYGTSPSESPVTLSHPLRPDSSYAISKTAGELYIQMSSLPWVSFRLANAYGPRNISGPLPTFYSRLTDNKPCFVMDTRRDFVFVSDMLDAVEQAVDGAGQGTYHLSSGGDVSIEELFNATLSAMDMTLDAPVEVRERGPDDAFTILLDPTRTVEELGWTPATALADGVQQAVDYYGEFGIAETYTHLHLPGDDKE